MIHEYALEPEVVVKWIDRQLGRYFIESFGLGQPRIVSRYPKRWKRLVWNAFPGGSELERKRLEELIERLSETMVKRRDGSWDSATTWLDNAQEEHTRIPFHAILARQNPTEHREVLTADELENSTPLWATVRGRTVPRTAGAMAAAVATMLRISEVTVFVDPHFGPENLRHRRPLELFLRATFDKRPCEAPLRLEVQSSSEDGRTYEFFRAACRDKLPRCVPSRVHLELIRLREKPGGERMHNRYILTDVGGVLFGVGLDEGETGDTDDIQLLDRRQYEERWRQYVDDGKEFDRPEAAVAIEGTA